MERDDDSPAESADYRPARRKPTNEKPLKIDAGFEEAVERFMRAPPMPKRSGSPTKRDAGNGAP
jgi:hypothetical protein